MPIIEAVDMIPGDTYFDSRNEPHIIAEKLGNQDESIKGCIAFVVRTNSNSFPEIFCRHERVMVVHASKHVDPMRMDQITIV